MDPNAGMESEPLWEKNRDFEMDKLGVIYLITALLGVPFALYFFLNFLSPLVYRITAMRISEVWLCGIGLLEETLTLV
jgi:hypothetical protein